MTMSLKGSKNSSRKKTELANEAYLSRPLDPEAVKRAEQLAPRYTIVLQPHERKEYVGTVLEFRTLFAFGKTPDECVRKVREVLTVAIAYMLEQGRRPPSPATEGTREFQINIRVSAEEKLLIETYARKSGFRGASDYARNAALAAAREPA